MGKNILKEFDIVEKEAEKPGQKSGSRFAAGFNNIVKKSLKAGAAAGGAAAAAGIVTGFKQGMKQENAEKVIGGLYGNADKAQKTIEGLRKVSKQSPIDFSSYTGAAESLAYAGVEGEQAIKTLENAGKAITSAGGGTVELDRAMNGVLKAVNNGGVAMMDSLGMISDSGIPILSALGDMMGKNTGEIKKMASEGKISIEDVMAVMETGTGETFQKMITAGEAASQSLGNQWKRVTGNIGESLGKAFLPIVEKLGPVIGQAGDAVAAFVDNQLGPWLTNTAIPALQQFAGWVQTAVVPALGQLWQFISTYVVPVLSTLAGFLINQVVPAISGFVGWLKSAYETIKPQIPVIAAFAAMFELAAAKILAAKVATQVAAAATKVWSGVTKAATAVQAAFNAVMKANPVGLVVSLIIGLVAAFVTFIATNDEARAKLVAVWNAIRNTVGNAISAIAGWFTNLPNTVGLLWSNFWRGIADWFSGLFSGIVGTVSNGLNTIIQWIGELPSKIVGALSNLWDTAVNLGKNIVNGFLQGLSNLGQKVKDALSEGIMKPVNWIKDKLGIRSPSVLMDDMGQNTGAGYANGVLKSAGNVQAAADQAFYQPVANAIEKAAREAQKAGVEAKGEGFFPAIMRGVKNRRKSPLLVNDTSRMANLYAGVNNMPAVSVPVFESPSYSPTGGVAASPAAQKAAKSASKRSASKQKRAAKKAAVKAEKRAKKAAVKAEKRAKKEAQAAAKKASKIADVSKFITRSFWDGLSGNADKVKSTVTSLIDKVAAVGGRTKLVKSLKKEQKQLTSLARQRDKIADKIKDAQQKLTDAIKEKADYQSGITDSLSGAGNVAEQGNKPEKILKNLTRQAELAKTFQKQIADLKKAGLDKDALDQIVSAGAAEGGVTAKALLDGGKSTIKQVNSLQKQITASSKKTAKTAGDAMFSAGVNTAKGIVKGIQSQKKALDREMDRLGKRMVSQVKKSLKIKSPSRVFADEVGKQIPAGVEQGIAAGQAGLDSAVDGMVSLPTVNIDGSDVSSGSFEGLEETAKAAMAGVGTATVKTVATQVDPALSRMDTHLNSPSSKAWTNFRTLVGVQWGKTKSNTKSSTDRVKSLLKTVEDHLGGPQARAWSNMRKHVADVWSRVVSKSRSSWTDSLKPTFESLNTMARSRVPEAFRAGRDGMAKAWDGIKKAAKDPVEFVVNTVYNDGLRDVWNKVAAEFDGKKLGRFKLPKGFSTGGWTGPGAKMKPAGLVHADEYVTRKWARRRIEHERPGLLDHINKTGSLAGYAKGGRVREDEKSERIQYPTSSRRVSSGFGGSRVGGSHAGIDFPVPIGTAVRAALSGRVVRAAVNAVTGRTGKGMLLSHSGNRNTYYGHLSGFVAKVGDLVKQGQVIAKSGNTGRSTGPHLHFETWSGGKPLNPAQFLAGAKLPSGGAFDLGGGSVDTETYLKPFRELKSDVSKMGGVGWEGLVKKVGSKMVSLSTGWVSDNMDKIAGDIGEGTGSFAGIVPGKGSVKSQVKAVADTFGWGSGDQWKAIDWIISRESGWNPKAANPTSSARGLFQKMTSIHGPLESTIGGQAEWGLKYFKRRYGSPLAAKAFWERNHWYANGGRVTPTLFDQGGALQPGTHLVANKTRRPEYILPPKITDSLMDGGSAQPNMLAGEINISAFDMDEALRKLETQQRRRQALRAF